MQRQKKGDFFSCEKSIFFFHVSNLSAQLINKIRFIQGQWWDSYQGQTHSLYLLFLPVAQKKLWLSGEERPKLCILHKNVLHQRVKGTGIADQFVKEADDVSKFWPVVSFFLPAMEHELMQRRWAAHRSWKSVTFFNGQNNLNANIHRSLFYFGDKRCVKQ